MFVEQTINAYSTRSGWVWSACQKLGVSQRSQDGAPGRTNPLKASLPLPRIISSSSRLVVVVVVVRIMILVAVALKPTRCHKSRARAAPEVTVLSNFFVLMEPHVPAAPLLLVAEGAPHSTESFKSNAAGSRFAGQPFHVISRFSHFFVARASKQLVAK